MLLLVNWCIVERIHERWKMEVRRIGGKQFVVWLKERILFRRSTFNHSIWVGMMNMVSVLLKKCMI